MSENFEISWQRIGKVIPADKMTDELKAQIEKLSDRVSQILMDTSTTPETYYFTSIKNVYRIQGDQTDSFAKKDIKSAKASKGLPDGKLKVEFNDGTTWEANDIKAGRVYDYAQDAKPRTITLAGYDHTIRGEFPQLLDPDHAEEVDRLRRWMQDGHISHYQYDDANPVLPKAGK